MKKTTVVNLLGGSGLGKSTTAALLYGGMKRSRWDVELVREVVKEWAWQGKRPTALGQSVLYGRQLERESDLYGKLEYLVTDSPLILCSVYRSFYYGSRIITPLILKDLEEAKKQGVDHVNFLLKRSKPFDARGRWEDEKTAKKIDQKVVNFMEYHDIPYVEVDVPDEERVDFIMDYLQLIKE